MTFFTLKTGFSDISSCLKPFYDVSIPYDTKEFVHFPKISFFSSTFMVPDSAFIQEKLYALFVVKNNFENTLANQLNTEYNAYS